MRVLAYNLGFNERNKSNMQIYTHTELIYVFIKVKEKYFSRIKLLKC